MFIIFAFALVGVIAVALIGCIGGGIGGNEAEMSDRRQRMLSAREAAVKLKEGVEPAEPSVAFVPSVEPAAAVRDAA